MSLAFTRKQWKPPLGTKINWSNPLADGLIGAWLFNESGGGIAYDISGNSNNGALQSGVTWTLGQFGSSLDFNDSSGAYVSTALVPEKTFTWSVWFNISPAAFGFYSILTVDGGNYILLDISSNTFSVFSADGLSGDSFGAPTLSSGVWYHVAFVRLGDSIANGYLLYLNGVLQGTRNSNSIGTFNPFTIGGRPNVPTQVWDGILDVTLVYNRALSAGEIQRLYSDPFCYMQKRRQTLFAPSGAPPVNPGYVYVGGWL